MSHKVFLSVGGTANDEQENFVRAVETRLNSEGLISYTIGRNKFSVDAPLKSIEELMDECVGTVVLALERTYFPEGIEKRNGENETAISNILLPTPWNQIEAAMAYSRRLPLLVIVQKGLKHEGLLEAGNDWYVHTIPMEEGYLYSSQFDDMLKSWKRNIDRKASIKTDASTDKLTDVSKMTVGQIVVALKPSHLWSILVSFCAALAGAYTLGAQLWP